MRFSCHCFFKRRAADYLKLLFSQVTLETPLPDGGFGLTLFLSVYRLQ